MEDPVAVFGRTDDMTITREDTITSMTCIHIPDTDWYMHDITYDGDQRMTRLYCGMYVFPMSMTRVYPDMDIYIDNGIVLSAMDIERTRLIEIIDRYIQELVTRRLGCSVRPRLKAWKAQLILDRIRRQWAARRVQKQFRESVSNPGYGLCKRRLLRELAEGI
jgi:hypothetical protein